MTKEQIIIDVKNKIKESSNNFKTPIDFFTDLKQKDFSRIELMIVDSAIKNFPFSTLHNVLLLKEHKFLELLQNISYKLRTNIRLI